jgi:V/A-type H+-transporting ATPase subunit I
VVINLLGAFVHPLRLEFVEFFGKFYDDGGSDFKPFGVDSKIVMITDKPQE